MADQQEILEAAERSRDQRFDIYDRHVGAMRVVMEWERDRAARLAQEAEDAIEVDEEWFRSVGGRNTFVDIMQDDVLCIPVTNGAPWAIEWRTNRKMLSICHLGIGLTIKVNATRGDVRRLLEALTVTP